MRCAWSSTTKASTGLAGRRLPRLPKIGCSANTLNAWVKKAEVDGGTRAGIASDTAEKLKALERENRELRQANEILRKGLVAQSG